MRDPEFDLWERIRFVEDHMATTERFMKRERQSGSAARAEVLEALLAEDRKKHDRLRAELRKLVEKQQKSFPIVEAGELGESNRYYLDGRELRVGDIVELVLERGAVLGRFEIERRGRRSNLFSTSSGLGRPQSSLNSMNTPRCAGQAENRDAVFRGEMTVSWPTPIAGRRGSEPSYLRSWLAACLCLRLWAACSPAKRGSWSP